MAAIYVHLIPKIIQTKFGEEWINDVLVIQRTVRATWVKNNRNIRHDVRIDQNSLA